MMKRHFLSKLALPLFGVASLCLCLTGCGGGDSGDSAAPTGDDASLEVDIDLGDLDVDTGDATETDGEPAAGDSSSVSEGWGNLAMRFVYDGDPPAQQKANITKDEDFCMKQPPMEEGLVVNADDKGIANVVVFLYVGRGDPAPTPHPSYEEVANGTVELDNAWCRFEPHICVVRTSQTLRVNNKDEVGHNTNAALADSFNEMIPKGEHIDKKMPGPERMPVTVSCNIHPWMKGYLVVKDHPYVAVSDANGRINMQNIPSGTWTFQVWHETPGYVTTVTIDGRGADWNRGRFDHVIQVGENDLGEIVIAPALFEESA